MNLPPILDKLLVMAQRDLLTVLRYRRALWLSAGQLLLEIAGSFYLARAVGPGFRPNGIGYYEFLLAGTSLFGFLMSVAYAMVITVQEAQVTGTMEILMTTPTPGSVTVLLAAFSRVISSALWFAATMAMGILVFRVEMPHPSWLGAIVIFALAVFSAAGIGLLAAALQVTIQRGAIIVGLLGSVGSLLTGVMFPVGVLPAPLRVLAEAVPFTHALRGFRMALFQGGGFTALVPSLLALVFWAAVLLPAGLLAFSAGLRRARMEGTLSNY